MASPKDISENQRKISIKVRKGVFVYAIFFGLLLFLKPGFNSNLDFESIGNYLIIFFIALMLFLYSQSKSNSNWFRIDFLFLIGFSIVHFQWPAMFALSGISPENIARVWVNSNYVNYGVWLSVIGIISWMIGYNWSKPVEIEKDKIESFDTKKLVFLAYASFFLFLAFAGKDYLTGGVYKGTGGSAAGEGISVYIRLVFFVSIILLTVLEITSKAKSYQGNLFKWFLTLNKGYLLLTTLFVLLFLSVGDRSEPIGLVIVGLVFVGTYVRPVRLREFLLLFIVGALVMTLISLGRSESTGIGLLTEGFSKFEFTSGYDVTLELANSVRTLYMSLSNVPSNTGFFYGQLWLGDILSPLPFAQSLLLSVSNIKAHELGSAGYITYLTFGSNPQSGEGTSLIGDIYLNFGSLGVVFFMFLFGMLLKKITNASFQCLDMKWVIGFGVMASLCFYISRSGLFVPTRSMVWALAFFVFFVTRMKK